MASPAGDDGAILAVATDTGVDAVQVTQPAPLAQMVAEVAAGKASSAYRPPVPPREDRSVPIQGYDPMRGYPVPGIKPHLSVVDAENRLIVTKLRGSSQHVFNYVRQPNSVCYFADLVDDQHMVASALITLLDARQIYGVDSKGKHASYTVSYDDQTRTLIFTAKTKDAAEVLVEVGKQVQELVGGEEDKTISMDEETNTHYGTRVAEEFVDFKAPSVVVKHQDVVGMMPAIIVRLRALGVTVNESSAEGKSLFDKLNKKITEWGTGGKEDEATGITIFTQHWADMLGMIAHVPEGPGGMKYREDRKKTFTEMGYGPEAAEFLMRGFPKEKFDTLVREIGTEIKRETGRRHGSDIGSINLKCIGEAAVSLITDALNKDVRLNGKALVNHGKAADKDRASFDTDAFDAAVRKEVLATVKAKRSPNAVAQFTERGSSNDVRGRV